jgi:hypothetical protein
MYTVRLSDNVWDDLAFLSHSTIITTTTTRTRFVVAIIIIIIIIIMGHISDLGETS